MGKKRIWKSCYWPHLREPPSSFKTAAGECVTWLEEGFKPIKRFVVVFVTPLLIIVVVIVVINFAHFLPLYYYFFHFIFHMQSGPINSVIDYSQCDVCNPEFRSDNWFYRLVRGGRENLKKKKKEKRKLTTSQKKARDRKKEVCQENRKHWITVLKIFVLNGISV